MSDAIPDGEQEGFQAHMVKPIDPDALTSFLEGVQSTKG
jgi:hypothetical protein